MMRRIALAVVMLLAASAAAAHDHFDAAGNCSGRTARFDGDPGFAKEEVVEAGNLPSLKLEASNAPVSVKGGNATGYTITVCKAAALEADLDAIKVRVEGGEVKTSGPANGRWSVAYRLDVPHGAVLDLVTQNGPLSLTGVDGKMTVNAGNGPLTLEDVGGEVDASAENGPVSIAGASGSLKVRARNGPLSVKLAGEGWSGSLDAATKNGPLSVKLPAGFSSAVLIEASGHSPVNCSLPECRGMKSLDPHHEGPRRIEIGSGAPVVRLSTVNGPVSVKQDQ